MDFRNFEFSQNDTSMSVVTKRKMVAEPFQGISFTFNLQLKWETTPILDPEFLLKSSVPIQVRKNGILRWERITQNEYKDPI